MLAFSFVVSSDSLVCRSATRGSMGPTHRNMSALPSPVRLSTITPLSLLGWNRRMYVTKKRSPSLSPSLLRSSPSVGSYEGSHKHILFHSVMSRTRVLDILIFRHRINITAGKWEQCVFSRNIGACTSSRGIVICVFLPGRRNTRGHSARQLC